MPAIPTARDTQLHYPTIQKVATQERCILYIYVIAVIVNGPRQESFSLDFTDIAHRLLVNLSPFLYPMPWSH